MELKEFREQLLEEVQVNAIANTSDDYEEFFRIFTSDLIDAEEFDVFEYVQFEGIAKNQKKIKIYGYSYNELDNELYIFCSTPLEYSDEIETLTLTEAKKIMSRAREFIVQANYIVDTAEESSQGYGLAYDITKRYSNVTKYKIYLLTDMKMSENITKKSIDADFIGNIRVEYIIWDIKRLYDLNMSKSGKEYVEIDLKEFTEYGIPCLPANQTEDYKGYLCIIPGEVLANLYNNYGGRLLEGNVRSFLQTKGKVNKGIRNTILNDPKNFFAYNNGIAGTATYAKTEEQNGTLYLSYISNLQIVNGGQTTASLAMALLNDKKLGSEKSIKQIYVPMKLSIVDEEKAQILIPNISRFANTQNKVSEADLWSNHPFHIRMEEYSRTIIAPATNGRQYGTYWYYERANGQYKQETYKSSEKERKSFEMKNPKDQMFKKVDLAKYWNIWNQKPYIASAGGQKAFTEFAKFITKKWEEDETYFNRGFFEDICSIAIICKRADKIVKSQKWFNSYKANIVAYSISLILYLISKNKELDLDLHNIWLKQNISSVFEKQIAEISYTVYKLLIFEKRPVENVTEWAKRIGCWEMLISLPIELNEDFKNELQPKFISEERKKDEKRDRKLTDNVEKMKLVYEFGVDNWKYLLRWNEQQKVLNMKEIDFIKTAIAIEKGKFPSEKQCVKIIEVLEHAREESFPR